MSSELWANHVNVWIPENVHLAIEKQALLLIILSQNSVIKTFFKRPILQLKKQNGKKISGPCQAKLFNAATLRILELPLKRISRSFTVEIFLMKLDQAQGGKCGIVLRAENGFGEFPGSFPRSYHAYMKPVAKQSWFTLSVNVLPVTFSSSSTKSFPSPNISMHTHKKEPFVSWTHPSGWKEKKVKSFFYSMLKEREADAMLGFAPATGSRYGLLSGPKVVSLCLHRVGNPILHKKSKLGLYAPVLLVCGYPNPRSWGLWRRLMRTLTIMSFIYWRITCFWQSNDPFLPKKSFPNFVMHQNYLCTGKVVTMSIYWALTDRHYFHWLILISLQGYKS